MPVNASADFRDRMRFGPEISGVNAFNLGKTNIIIVSIDIPDVTVLLRGFAKKLDSDNIDLTPPIMSAR
jgi:hypothetical protein